MYYCYERISRDPDNTSEAIERQEVDTAKKAKALGWEPIEHIQDRNISAWRKRGSRPGFNRLLELISTGQAEGVIVWNLDRLLRRTDELDDLIKAIDAWCVKTGNDVFPIHTVDGVLDVSTPYNRGMAKIQVTIAQMESDIKSMRVKRSLEGKTQERAYADDPTNTDIVIWIAKELLAGASYAQIADQLNADGHLTSRGLSWKYSTVRQVINNKRIVPSIIGDRAWVKVQQACERRATAHAGTRTDKHDYILTGLLTCDICDQPMVGKGIVMRGKYHPRYACNPNRLGGGCGQSIQAEKLEDQVTGWVRGELTNDRLQELTVATMDPTIQDRIDQLEHDYYLDDDVEMDKPTFVKLRAALVDKAVKSPTVVGSTMAVKEFDKLDNDGLRAHLPRLIDWVRIQQWDPHGPRYYNPGRVVIRGR